VLKTGQYVRSVARDERLNRNHARWVSQDVDGDGLMMVMRKADPGGEIRRVDGGERLLLERALEDRRARSTRSTRKASSRTSTARRSRRRISCRTTRPT
jgi:hypothetical protein